jgi:NhaP-type Na+/H+ and K+/H+ antiporter
VAFFELRRLGHQLIGPVLVTDFLKLAEALLDSAIAGRIERSLISGPIVFTAVGFVLGADGLGILCIHVDGEGLRLLAELTLAMVLFTDAANANFSSLKLHPLTSR